MDQPRNRRWKPKVHENKWIWKHNGPKYLGCNKSCSKKKVYSNTGLLQEARKIWNEEHNLTPKRVRNITTNKTQTQQKELNNKN